MSAAGAAFGCGVASASAATVPIGAHSMLQLNDPPSFMEAMFREAAAMGAAEIRLDVAPAFVFSSSGASPDFSGLDEVMALSTEYHLPVLADLLTIPWWMADCEWPASTPSDEERCATNDLSDYSSVIGQIVAHADPVIRDWEVWNEPDTSQFFNGTPAQYAWMLRTAHDAIKQVDAGDRVLLGGVSSPVATGWLGQVFATPGADAIHAFDIANLHDRNQLDVLAGDVTGFRSYLAGAGFTGPLWITEHGYPSDAAYQYDTAFAGGPAAQAAFLRASVPTLVAAGAAEVFVTERDNLGGQYASEGVLGGDVADPAPADPQVVEKPAYGALLSLAGCWAQLGRDCLQSPPAAAPASVAWAPVALRATPETTVTVSDPGGEPDALGSATVTGAQAGAFSISSDSCSQRLLEPDETCALKVRFHAAAGGASIATLDLSSDQGTVSVPLSATVPSVSALTTMPVRFVPLRHADGPGDPQIANVALHNPLGVPVQVGAVSLRASPRFLLMGDSCAAVTLAPGATCDQTVVWLPGTAGTGRATLTVSGDGAPTVMALTPYAAPLPRVTGVHASSPCLSAGRAVRVRVAITAPGRVTWTLRRAAHVPDRACHAAARADTTRSSARGSARVSGADAAGHFVVPGGGRWAPGTYRLSVTPVDGAGAGAGRAVSVWLTVAAPS